jgi:hypothetical protein
MEKIVRHPARGAALTTGFLTTSTPPVDARGGHGFGRSFGGHGLHGRQTTGDSRHGNDAYMKAASDETDKLLKGRLNSICRGC